MNNAKKELRKAKREAREAQQRKRTMKLLFGALVLLILLSIIVFGLLGNVA